jgi:hypothetical protein
MKLDPTPVTGTNDVLNVVNGAGVTYGGVLILTNVSATPFAAGNTFKLFQAGSYNGTFTSVGPVPGTGLKWDTNNLPNGIVSVVSTSAPPPVITSITLSGTNLVLQGSNSIAGQQYHVLSSANVALPLTNWTVLPGGTFTGPTFSITNTVNPNAPKMFFIIRVP